MYKYFGLILAFVFATSAWSQQADHEWTDEELAKLTPKEFAPEEIAKEVAANRRASTGKQKIDSIKVEWSPEGTILTGSPVKLKAEAENLRAVLLNSGFKNFAKEVVYAEGSKELNLTNLIRALKAEEENINMKDNVEKIHFCHSFSLWFLGHVKERQMNFKDLDKKLKTSRRLNLDNKPKAGDVAVIYDQGRKNEDVHSFVYVSDSISLEKRGSGAILIRPPSEIINDYKGWTKNMESSTPLPKRQRNLIQYWSSK
jgi:hypothetical protein